MPVVHARFKAAAAEQRHAVRMAVAHDDPSAVRAALTKQSTACTDLAEHIRVTSPSIALTGHLHQDEAGQDAEADDLILFAASLDYDEFVQDLEVQAALSFLKEGSGDDGDLSTPTTTSDLHTEREAHPHAAAGLAQDRTSSENQRPLTASIPTCFAPRLNLLPDKERHATINGLRKLGSLAGRVRIAKAANQMDAEVGDSVREQEMQRQLQKVAAHLLRSCTVGRRTIHSRQSVQKLIDTQRESSSAFRESLSITADVSSNISAVPTVTAVLISTTKERSASNLSDPSQLPFLHRNPAA